MIKKDYNKCTFLDADYICGRLVPQVGVYCNFRDKTENITDYGTIEYQYTEDGYLKKILYPDTVVENSYDNMGNIKTVKIDGVQVSEYGYAEENWMDYYVDKTTGKDKRFDFTYDAVGHKTQIKYPNRTKMKYDFGTAYRLNSADGYLVKTDGSEELMSKNRITLRDNVGNIKEKEILTGAVEYGYDNLYQLTNYKNPHAGNTEITYNYDYAGNRDSVLAAGEDAASFSYQNTHNKIQSVSENGNTITYDYDYKGNVIRKGSDVYYWDYKNRLVMAYIPGGNVSYKYNINDLKLERTSDNKTTRYYYNGSRLLCEKDTSGKLTKVYLQDDEGFLGMTRHVYDDNSIKKASQNLYYLFDDLGSVTTVTNDIGMPVQMYSYDPYGNITNATTDPVNNLAFVGRYGGYKDWDTGLINFWHRWYDSRDGKWTSRDPIGVEGGINLYGYVGNNSLNKIDINGYYGYKVGCECMQKRKIASATKKACDRLYIQITNPDLRECMKKKCDSMTVECSDEYMGGEAKCNSDSISIGNGEVGHLDSDNLAATIMHEMAHTCCWDHNGQCGVPFQDGKAHGGNPWNDTFPRNNTFPGIK